MGAGHGGGALGRTRTERARRESEQQFRDFSAGSPDAVFVEDFQGTVLDVNPAACQLHGMKREELVGKNVNDLVPPAARKDATRDFGELVEGRLKQVEGFSWAADARPIPAELRPNRLCSRGH